MTDHKFRLYGEDAARLARIIDMMSQTDAAEKEGVHLRALVKILYVEGRTVAECEIYE